MGLTGELILFDRQNPFITDYRSCPSVPCKQNPLSKLNMMLHAKYKECLVKAGKGVKFQMMKTLKSCITSSAGKQSEHGHFPNSLIIAGTMKMTIDS